VQELVGQDWPTYFAPIPEEMTMYACCADRYNTIMRRRIKTVLDQRPILVHKPAPVDDVYGVNVDPDHKRNTRSKDGGRERVRYGIKPEMFLEGDYYDGDISLLGLDEDKAVSVEPTFEPSIANETNTSGAECKIRDAWSDSVSSSVSGKENLSDSVLKSNTPPPVSQNGEDETILPMFHSRVLSVFPEAGKGM
jgi:hypothetical protein